MNLEGKHTPTSLKRNRHDVPKTVVGLSVAALSLALACGGSTLDPKLDKALWIANGTNVVEYIPAQLAKGAPSEAPHLVNNSSVFGAPQGVTFDAQGNLWVIDGGTLGAGGTANPALYEFTAAQLAGLHANNSPMPSVALNSASFTFPQQAVFDPHGNLWVSDNGSNAVFVFTPEQLMAPNSNVTPYISITSSPAFMGPLGITFDAAGDLWVANNASTTLFEFEAKALPSTPGSVTLAPNVTLSDDGNGSIQAPWALVFDSVGDLWSSNANAPNTVVKFAKADLGTSGSPVPAVTLGPTTVGGNSTLAAPNGIAFDNLGDLASISSASPFGVAVFGHEQLVSGGAIAPDAFVAGTVTTLDAPAGCNYGPVVN